MNIAGAARRLYPVTAMVHFACDNKETEKLLRTLHKQVLENGGVFYDGLTVGCQKGDFKIDVPAEACDGRFILIMPKSCLLPVAKFELGLKGNDIIIKSHDKSLSKGQVSIMKTFIALYNSTGKIAAHKKTVTMRLLYDEPELMERLLAGRSPNVADTLRKLAEGNRQAFFLNSFIKSRVLGFMVQDDSSEGRPDEQEAPAALKREQVMMPFIDFLNHHPAAEGFSTLCKAGIPLDDGKEAEGVDMREHEGVAVQGCHSLERGDECFVSYGPYEAHDTLLNYNYVETHCHYMRSVPVEVRIDGIGRLVVNSVSATGQKGKLPQHVKDLRFYLPAITHAPKQNTVVLRFLLIPQQQAPRSMRRVLGLALKTLAPQADEATLWQGVLQAERAIIAENMKYYRALDKAVKVCKPKPSNRIIMENIRLMVQTQLAHIKAYPFYDEATAKKRSQKTA
ncbi:MAG: hypothetical protein H6867_05100 [Rhodospirillales bacterium]|nr:hypothetical protein [Rhodospirillales bacterium]MCB9994905.1 hypothetical protein [Rhodospirillales bacterium]